jgi:glycosyltransferase involved in cell wall biosynthesis
MKVLFVCSGNDPKFEISPFIKSQGDSLLKSGIDVEYFQIRGKGLRGYYNNIKPLRKKINNNKYNIVHSHYSLSGWISLLTFTKVPKIISFMGCDVYGDYDENGKLKFKSIINIISAKLLQFFKKKIIVKSENLKSKVNIKNKVEVIPNGVNTKIFYPINKEISREKLGLRNQENYILFLGNKRDKRKNFNLLDQASSFISQDFKILNPYPILHKKVPLYINACDVLVLTSYKEGSPNVIKEAMACNCPIVSTDVGDVRWVIGNTNGCYLTSFDPSDVAEKLKLALQFGKRTNGREKIKHLDSKIIAKKIINIYEGILTKEKF